MLEVQLQRGPQLALTADSDWCWHSRGRGEPEHNCRYNEVVLDPSSWNANLPGTVEAIFYVGGAQASALGEQKAREVHSQFVQQFGLSRQDVPLLRYEAGASAGNAFLQAFQL